MIYVLYHKNCMDGFGAAFAAKRYLDEMNMPITYIDVTYNMPPPEMEPDSTVYIVDFSYKKDVLLELAKKHKKIVILDHHATSSEDLKDVLGTGNISGEFDMNRSGAVIAWEYFNTNEPPPRLLNYIQDRDLWNWKLENTKEILELLLMVPQTFDAWTDFAKKLEDDESFANSLELGRLLIKRKEQDVEMICRNAILVDTPHGKCSVVNSSLHMSELGHRLLEKFPDTLFSASYYMTRNGKWKWSLRSEKDGADVSLIAASFGGGGHKSAAGFYSDDIVFK